MEYYRTSFEAAEGYDSRFTLVGQQGWIGTDLQGNGLVEFFPNLGQQAYVGFAPLTPGQDVLSVWTPINLAPIPRETPVIEFSVLMAVIDVTTNAPHRDCFRWSVYNVQTNRLLTVDFDNETLGINYLVENGTFFDSTGRTFSNDVIYQLTITMDFGANRWTASLDGTPLVPPTPITTTNTPLNLGDVDAVWFHRQPGAPGDNFMLFDNYQITAEAPPPPRLIEFGRPGGSGGPFFLRLQGERERKYAVEASGDLSQWTVLRTNVTNSDGLFDFVDTDASSHVRRFYRARLVP